MEEIERRTGFDGEHVCKIRGHEVKKEAKLLLKGYTLVELLISSVIFVVLAMSIYSSFYAGIFGNKSISESLRVYQAAAQVLECINTDLRNSFTYSKDISIFEGDSVAIRFLSIVDTYRGNVLERDYASIAYKLEDGKLMRQSRLNALALNNNSNAEFEEMVSNVKELVFTYGKLDESGRAIEWQQDWHEPSALPAAVKVNLVLEGKNKEEFERIIYLPLSK